MIPEIVRIIAYGGIGLVVGYAVGIRVNDLHWMAHHPESRRTKMDSHRRSTLQVAAIMAAMLALLLTGVAMFLNDQDREVRDQQRCEDLQDVVEALDNRTAASQEIAATQDQLWHGIKGLVLDLEEGNDSPLVTLIDRYEQKREKQKTILDQNQIDSDLLEGC